MLKLKRYAIQTTPDDTAHLVHVQLPRVNYRALFLTLRYPVLWVHEELLQAWLPLEVDFNFINRLSAYKAPDERFERRLMALGLNVEPIPSRAVLAESMRRDGVVIVRGLFTRGMCKQLADYYFRQPETHNRWDDLPGTKRTSVNNMLLMRHMHQSTENLARAMLGDVKTSYSFTSAYESGTVLPVHTDRPQCVYNASVMLAIDPSSADPKRWPLMISVNDKVNVAALDIGDAVYYSGIRDPHWREMLPADVQGVLGMFFHYVNEDFTGSLD